MTALDDVSTLEQAAAYLKLEPAVLNRMARAHKIGSILQGRARLFPRDSVLEYVKANTIAPTPPNPHGLTDQALARVRAGAR